MTNRTHTQQYRIIRFLLKGIAYGLLLMVVGGVIGVLMLRSQALPESFTPQTTQIFTAQGELLDTIHAGENRRLVALSDISPYLIQATIAVEDHRFYQHLGLDLRGIARAVLVNLRNGDKAQGASTLTQQLARNLYLTHDKTWTRKIKEAIYALQLEMQYSKDEILEKYLNEIYYGHAAYGIEAAARLYFDKPARELNLAESTLLASVPKGPRYYSPYLNADNAKKRQRLILQTMVNQGIITATEAEVAAAQTLTLLPLDRYVPNQAPYFRDFIRQQAMSILELEEDDFIAGGYRVYTTLDMRMQNIAEEIINTRLADSGLQTALVAIDPRTGSIKALVGGVNYADNQYNRAFATTRQPGSSFKPFVYLTALEQGTLTAISRFKSEPTTFMYDEGRRTYSPSNFGNVYPEAEITMREAIARSDNIYAVNTIMQAGPEAVIDTARAFGIASDLQPLPSLALGTFPISPLEMASAFGVLANQGERHPAHGITRIEDSRGQVLYEAADEAIQVVNPATAYVMTNLLSSVFEPGGTASRVAKLIKRPVAGKTGTTNTDSWMVGYTPELSTAVWIGHDRDQHISATESYLAAPIFAEFTERALESVPPKLFSIPDGVTTLYVEKESGTLAAVSCGPATLEIFIAGTEPTEWCIPVDQLEPITPSSEEPAAQEKKSWWNDFKRWWSQ